MYIFRIATVPLTPKKDYKGSLRDIRIVVGLVSLTPILRKIRKLLFKDLKTFGETDLA